MSLRAATVLSWALLRFPPTCPPTQIHGLSGGLMGPFSERCHSANRLKSAKAAAVVGAVAAQAVVGAAAVVVAPVVVAPVVVAPVAAALVAAAPAAVALAHPVPALAAQEPAGGAVRGPPRP